MNIEALEAVRDNKCFVLDNILFDLKLEHAIVICLKMFMVECDAAFDLIEATWFTDFYCSQEFEQMRSVRTHSGNIIPEMKDLIWKLNRYWVCRLCRDVGMTDYDWRTITVEYVRFIGLDQYNMIREWERKFEAVVSFYSRKQRREIVGKKTLAKLFEANFFTSGPVSYCPEVDDGKIFEFFKSIAATLPKPEEPNPDTITAIVSEEKAKAEAATKKGAKK